MEVHPDFKELLTLFAKHKVNYVIVGGYALAFHGAPRYTGNLDVLVDASVENAPRILDALKEFGFGDSNLQVSDFTTTDNFVRLGHPPVRIDILTSISGVTWETVHRSRVPGKYGEVLVHFIGRAEFLVNKRASGRAKDLADIEALGES